MPTDPVFGPVTDREVKIALDQLLTFEAETQPKVEKYVEENQERLVSEPEEVFKEMDKYLTAFGESIGIVKDSEQPIVENSGDPIQAALQLRGFYIGILTARVLLEEAAGAKVAS